MNQRLLVVQSSLIVAALILLWNAGNYWKDGAIAVIKEWPEKHDPVADRAVLRPGLLFLLPVLEDTPKKGFRVIYTRENHPADYYYPFSTTAVPAVLLLVLGLSLHLFWRKAVERWESDISRGREDRSRALLDETLRNREGTSKRPGFKTGKAE
jgi:hypothetical protein